MSGQDGGSPRAAIYPSSRPGPVMTSTRARSWLALLGLALLGRVAPWLALAHAGH